jgi:hypothetical protein
VHTANWTGNIVTDHAYHYAKGRWNVPAAHSPSGDKDYDSSSWVGIGQGNSSSKPLAQAGTRSDCLSGCYYTHYSIWWEVYPHNSEQEVSTDVHAGDSIYSSVTFVTNKATMHIVDETTDEGGIYTYTGSFSADGTAEWIFERPTVGGYFPHLTAASTTFTDAYAKYGTTTKALGSLPHYYTTMWNCTSASDTRLAYPGAITSSGTKFIAHWKAYGARSKASTCSTW